MSDEKTVRRAIVDPQGTMWPLAAGVVGPQAADALYAFGVITAEERVCTVEATAAWWHGDTKDAERAFVALAQRLGYEVVP